MNLVRFTHHGSNFHRVAAGDDSHKFEVADMSERRARRVNKKPTLMGYGLSHGSIKSAKEQEERWIKYAGTTEKTNAAEAG